MKKDTKEFILCEDSTVFRPYYPRAIPLAQPRFNEFDPNNLYATEQLYAQAIELDEA